MKKILLSLLVLLLLVPTAYADRTERTFWEVSNSTTIRTKLYDATNRYNVLINGNLEVTGTLTVAGILLTGNLDLDGYNLIMDTDGDTILLGDRDAMIADDEIGLQIAGAVDFIFSANNLGVLAGSGVSFADNAPVRFGNTAAAPDVSLYWNTAQTVNALTLGLPAGQNNFIIAETADLGVDFAHPASVDPTLFIQSHDTQSTTEWLGLYYTSGFPAGGKGVFEIGDGGFYWRIAGAETISLSSNRILTFTGGSGGIGASSDNASLKFYSSTSLSTAGFKWYGNTSTNEADANIMMQLTGALGFVLQPPARTSGVASVFKLVSPADTGRTAATANVGVDFDLDATKTWAAGAGPLATQREILIQAPTYAGNAGGALTITDAYTTYITGAPTQGASMTFTRRWALGMDGAIDVNYSRTGYSTLVGIVDIVRSGDLTGVATETIIDLNIAPSFTLTEPGAGTITYYGASIDISSVAVTADAGTSVLSALNLVANADADVGTNLALKATGDIRLTDGRIYGGGIQANKQNLAANTNLTLDENDSVVNVTTGGVSDNTITLPAATGNEGMIISIYMVTDGGFNAVLTRAGGDVIQNGSADLANTTVTLNDVGDFVMIQGVNGTMWQILVNSGGIVN